MPPRSTQKGSYRFSIKTQVLQDYGIQTPVMGANPLVVARRRWGLELISIGSDGHLHILRRDAGSSSSWSVRRLEQPADRVTAIPQKDGLDKVFFATLTEHRHERIAEVFELIGQADGERFESRSQGCLVTSDSRVYGLACLSGSQLSDGSNALVTALAAYPPETDSSWAVLFRHGAGSGVLSLDSKAVAGERICFCDLEPATLSWPNLPLLVLHDGHLRLEWGYRDGPLMQTRTCFLPPLDPAPSSSEDGRVVEFDVVRDAGDRLRLFAIDAEHRLHTLGQIGGGGSEPPRWAEAWTPLTGAGGPPLDRVPLDRVHAFRRGDHGGFDVFAIDHDDQLWYVDGDDLDRYLNAGTPGAGMPGAGMPDAGAPAAGTPAAGTPAADSPSAGPLILQGLRTRAAQLTPVLRRDGMTEVVAVSRQNRVARLWRRADGAWGREEIRWPVAARPSWLQVYRSGITVLDESRDRVPGVPVEITSTERLPMVVNGLSYTIGPAEPVVAQTNPFGQVNVTFEINDHRRIVPSLSFSGEFLSGVLNVSPARKAQIYVPSATSARLLEARRSSTEMFLVPENTVLKNS